MDDDALKLHPQIVHYHMLGDCMVQPATVEEQAHHAIMREFDPEYLPRLHDLMDALTRQMAQSCIVPGEFTKDIQTAKQLADMIEEAKAAARKKL